MYEHKMNKNRKLFLHCVIWSHRTVSYSWLRRICEKGLASNKCTKNARTCDIVDTSVFYVDVKLARHIDRVTPMFWKTDRNGAKIAQY
jgi:hypothetical protein